MRMRSIFVGLIFLAATPALACDINQAGSSDVGMTVFMTMRPGEGCSFPITPASRFGSATVVSLSIVQRAAHGRAGVAGRSGVAYIAHPTYVGSDSFTASLVVDRNGTRETGALLFRVDVGR